jgi:hypothetical protein
MTKKSFDFGVNPTAQFLSSSPPPDDASTPSGNQTVPRPPQARTNKKDKRICVMIQSTLCDDIAKIARVKGISKNEIYCRAVAEYRDNEKRDLERYDTMFGDQSDQS